MTNGMLNSRKDGQEKKGKVILITGADTGFGRLTAIQLAHKGYAVFATCLDAEKAAATPPFSELRQQKPTTFHVIQMDVTNDKQIQEATETITEWFNSNPAFRLHGIFNNAGITFPMVPIELYSFSSFEKVFDVNVFGALRVVKAFTPLMRASGKGGRIVNMASLAGELSCPMMSAYCSSKTALIAISDTLRYEMRCFGISVSVILPDLRKTELVTNKERTLAALEKELQCMDAETMTAYGGHKRVEKMVKMIDLMDELADPNLNRVVHDVVDALCSRKPKKRYYPINWKTNLVISLSKLFPSLLDKLVMTAEADKN